MARTAVDKPTKSALKCLVFSFFLTYVRSQFCTAPFPNTCICSEDVFNCTSGNLTEFSSDLPNSKTLVHIVLSNNDIMTIDNDVLSAYTKLETITLAENGLTRIAEQSLPETLKKIDLSYNPLTCDDSLVWLAAVPQVIGTCRSGVNISLFLDKRTATAATNDTTQEKPMVTQPMSDSTMGSTPVPPEANKLYILAILIPILILVVIVTVIVIFTIRKNHQQKESYNSAIRYSVVRKDAGARNRVYSDVTTEL